jgi:hypothetical protein
MLANTLNELVRQAERERVSLIVARAGVLTESLLIPAEFLSRTLPTTAFRQFRTANRSEKTNATRRTTRNTKEEMRRTRMTIPGGMMISTRNTREVTRKTTVETRRRGMGRRRGRMSWSISRRLYRTKLDTRSLKIGLSG